MFEFSYKTEYPSLNFEVNNFNLSNYQLKDAVDLRNDFLFNGISVLKVEKDNPERMCNEFKKLGNLFGKNPVRDATRRSISNTKSNQTNLNTVDSGKFVGPHAETSFSPARPSVIGFVCLDIDENENNNGLTTLIDGFNLWKDLSIKTKKILLSSNINYSLSIDTPVKKKLPKGIREWYLEYNGVYDVLLDGDNNKINFNFTSPFVSEHPIERFLTITNHSFIFLNTEPQILERKFNLPALTANELNAIKEDVHNSLNENIVTFKWETGLVLYLDNFRFMHGRLPYDLNLKRKLYITQLRNYV